ncbi:MAG: DUF192 domain-containing protein [Candidatus Vogelbacteria bacterium]
MRRVIVIGLLVILAGFLGTRAGLVLVQAPPLTPTILTIGNTKILVEIADTEATRTRGLSGRPSLAENTGLLFIFDHADYYNFWMKEMNFPIDIIWFDDNWRVIDVTINALPQDFPATYQPRAPARYVLEVNAGFSSAHQITIGAQAILH